MSNLWNTLNNISQLLTRVFLLNKNIAVKKNPPTVGNIKECVYSYRSSHCISDALFLSGPNVIGLSVFVSWLSVSVSVPVPVPVPVALTAKAGANWPSGRALIIDTATVSGSTSWKNMTVHSGPLFWQGKWTSTNVKRACIHPISSFPSLSFCDVYESEWIIYAGFECLLQMFDTVFLTTALLFSAGNM